VAIRLAAKPGVKGIYSESTITRSLAEYFDYRTQRVVVPNVGLFGWEMDLCIVSAAGVITEVEIKCSLADWQCDRDKDKWRMTAWGNVGRFYYAVPHFLANKVPDWVADYVGVISVGTDDDGKLTKVIGVSKEARLRSKYRASPRDVEFLFRGACLRYWDKKTGCVA
jgi:hypothetical protein